MSHNNSSVIKNLRHHFLVATDRLNDTPFNQAVIYVCQHDGREGAMGVRVNAPTEDINFNDVAHGMGIEDLLIAGYNRQPTLLNGGPVDTNKGIIIHTPDYRLKNSIDIGPGVTLSATGGIVKDIARGMGPKKMNFCLGYAGWTVGQLENEIIENDWLVLPADESILFKTAHKNRYSACTAALGLNALNFGSANQPIGLA